MAKKKDLRLGKRGNSVSPFLTRSKKLAKDLMKAVGVRESIIEVFEAGNVLKTNCKNPLSITHECISKKDREIILDLKKNGLLAYHVLESYIMIGKQIEIQCEHEVSTYEKIICTKSYLCVPEDIFAEATSFDKDFSDISNRDLVIKEYIEHEIFMANQGYLYAYVLNDDGSSDFYHIEARVFNGDLLRIS